MQLVEERHRGVLDPPEAAELEVALAGHGEEGVAAVHEVTGHEWVGVLDGVQAGGRLRGVEADREEDLLVLLHRGEHLRRGGEEGDVGE